MFVNINLYYTTDYILLYSIIKPSQSSTNKKGSTMISRTLMFNDLEHYLVFLGCSVQNHRLVLQDGLSES